MKKCQGHLLFIDVIGFCFLTIGISVNTLNERSNVERAFGSMSVVRIKSGKVGKAPVNIL